MNENTSPSPEALQAMLGIMPVEMLASLASRQLMTAVAEVSKVRTLAAGREDELLAHMEQNDPSGVVASTMRLAVQLNADLDELNAKAAKALEEDA